MALAVGDAGAVSESQPPQLTTTKVGMLIVSMFDGSSKQLIWRGASSSDLSSNPEKNTKSLDKDVQKMFKDFPPRKHS